VLVIFVKVFRWYFKLITLHLRNPYSCNNAESHQFLSAEQVQKTLRHIFSLVP
jgi:hypothetical protein